MPPEFNLPNGVPRDANDEFSDAGPGDSGGTAVFAEVGSGA